MPRAGSPERSTVRRERGHGRLRAGPVRDRAWAAAWPPGRPGVNRKGTRAGRRKCRVPLDLACSRGHSPRVPRPLRSRLPAPARRLLLADLAARAVLPGTPLDGRLERARSARIPRRSLVELGLMLPLYAGFPAAIEYLRALSAGEPPRTIARRRA